MKCTNCGSELPPNSKFCEQCGTKVKAEETTGKNYQVTKRCKVCGAELKPGFMFCGRCGAPVREYWKRNPITYRLSTGGRFFAV